MATLEEVYQKVLADEGERAAFVEAGKTAEGLEVFLKDHGCEASLEEVGEFLKAKQSQQGELADEELDSVAGGCAVEDTGLQVCISISLIGCLALID